MSGTAVQRWEVHDAILESGLPRLLKNMALAVWKKVDASADWSWPRDPDSDHWGATVEELARIAGYCRRSGSRGLRGLEQLGLVCTTFRSWLPSHYQLLPAAWLERLGRKPRHPDRPSADGPRLEVGLPAWAQRIARHERRTAAEVHELVAGAARLFGGAEVDPTTQGLYARPVVRLWRALDYPEPSGLLKDLARVLAAARGCAATCWDELRGVRAGRRVGESRLHRAGVLCAPSRWAGLVVAARDHAEGCCRCRQLADDQVARATVAASLAPAEVGCLRADHRDGGAVDADVDPVTSWAAAIAELRLEDRVHRIWIAPARPVEVRDDALVVAVPSRAHAVGLVECFGGRLTDSLGGPLLLTWGPDG